MNNKESTGHVIMIVVGAILFGTGVVLAILFTEPQGIMKALPFICIGVGLGVLGGGIGGAVGSRLLLKNPSLAKQKEIETKDERNITIANKAKAKAFSYTLILFSALVIFLALVQVEAYIIFVVVGAYLSVILVFICFLTKYHKEM